MLLILEREEVGEGGREGRGETERERDMDVREKH